MRRILVPLLVVLGALAGPGAARAQTGGPGPVDPRLFVIGDSVILGVRDTLGPSLPGWQVNVFAQEGFSTLAAPQVINASRPLIGEVVVVGLGNNDAGNPATFAKRIDAVMQALPGVKRVIWVNLRNYRAFVPALDMELTAAPARWPNLEIADWNARAGPDPSLVYPDGLHLTPAGQAAMAQLIAQHLDAYVKSRTSTSTSTSSTTRAPSATHRRSRHPSPRRHPADPGLSAGAIVGIGAGALLLAGLGLVWWGSRRRRRTTETIPASTDEP